MQRATPTTWKREPLPLRRAQLNYHRCFSRCEFDRVAFGLVPQQMEDRWFVLFERGWLLFYRSWTGHCIYGLKLTQTNGGGEVTDSWVTGDRQVYRSDGAEFDRELLDNIIAWMVSDERHSIDS